MAFAMMENQAVDTANAGPTLLAPPVKSAFLGNMELIVPMVSAQIELLFWFNGLQSNGCFTHRDFSARCVVKSFGDHKNRNVFQNSVALHNHFADEWELP